MASGFDVTLSNKNVLGLEWYNIGGLHLLPAYASFFPDASSTSPSFVDTILAMESRCTVLDMNFLGGGLH